MQWYILEVSCRMEITMLSHCYLYSSVTYQLDKILVKHSEWAHVGSFVV
jgi:hypothetical protein